MAQEEGQQRSCNVGRRGQISCDVGRGETTSVWEEHHEHATVWEEDGEVAPFWEEEPPSVWEERCQTEHSDSSTALQPKGRGEKCLIQLNTSALCLVCQSKVWCLCLSISCTQCSSAAECHRVVNCSCPPEYKGLRAPESGAAFCLCGRWDLHLGVTAFPVVSSREH